MELTLKEQLVVDKMREGWTCRSYTAWDGETGEKLPYYLHLRLGDDYGNTISIHGRVAKSLVRKKIIQFQGHDSIYFLVWSLII